MRKRRQQPLSLPLSAKKGAAAYRMMLLMQHAAAFCAALPRALGSIARLSGSITKASSSLEVLARTEQGAASKQRYGFPSKAAKGRVKIWGGFASPIKLCGSSKAERGLNLAASSVIKTQKRRIRFRFKNFWIKIVWYHCHILPFSL